MSQQLGTTHVICYLAYTLNLLICEPLTSHTIPLMHLTLELGIDSLVIPLSCLLGQEFFGISLGHGDAYQACLRLQRR